MESSSDSLAWCRDQKVLSTWGGSHRSSEHLVKSVKMNRTWEYINYRDREGLIQLRACSRLLGLWKSYLLLRLQVHIFGFPLSLVWKLASFFFHFPFRRFWDLHFTLGQPNFMKLFKGYFVFIQLLSYLFSFNLQPHAFNIFSVVFSLRFTSKYWVSFWIFNLRFCVLNLHGNSFTALITY